MLEVQTDGLDEHDHEAAEVVVDQDVQVKQEVVPDVYQNVEEGIENLTAECYPSAELALVPHFLSEEISFLFQVKDRVSVTILQIEIISQLLTLQTLFYSNTNIIISRNSIEWK